MNILVVILLVITVIIAIPLLLALFTKKEYKIERHIIVDAPLHKVFEYVKYLKNWDNFNKRAVADNQKVNEFKGVDGTPGFIYGWKGNKNVGEGEKEIKNIIEYKIIETEIRFKKPMQVTGYTNIETSSLTPGQTRVTLTNRSKLNYPFNIMLLVVEKSIAKDMDNSLLSLKNILEQ